MRVALVAFSVWLFWMYGMASKPSPSWLTDHEPATFEERWNAQYLINQWDYMRRSDNIEDRR